VKWGRIGGITTTTKGCKLKTIAISLVDSAEDETVTAEYFQIEDSWVTFKTSDHKAVASYPETRVTRIKSEPAEGNIDAMVAVGGRRFLVEAFDMGFAACAGQYDAQRNDPSRPIIRRNPYEAAK